MRILTFAALLLMAACSKPAEPQQPAAPAAPVVADTWPGKYWGDTLRITINGAPNEHKVMMIAAKADCSGDLGLAENGIAARSETDDDMTVVLPTAPEECTIDLRKTGNILTVTESVGCTTLHGAMCSFNGTAERAK